MNILIVTQYFWPENFIINDIVKVLREQGCNIVVATGKPNYPGGKVFHGYSAEGTQVEIFEKDVEVVRVPLRPRASGGGRNLFLNYMSFVWNGIIYFPKLLKDRKFDAILVYAPSPITMVIPAILLKSRMKAKLAVWVQDLWPESMQATGHMTHPKLLALVGWVVKHIYKHTDRLLVQSRAFIGPVSRYASADKIVYYPNSYLEDINSTHSCTVAPDLMKTLDEKFCLVFAGNLGSAQALDTLIMAAEKLVDLAELKFVFVGSGSRFNWLENEKATKGLENVVIAGRYPSTDMPQIFRRAKGLLVSLKNEEIFAYTIPSKIQAYLASGRPLIASLNGEGARVVEEAGAGLVSPAEDVEKLVENIREFYIMPRNERELLGQSAKEYFLEHFDMNRQCRELVKILKNMTLDGGTV